MQPSESQSQSLYTQNFFNEIQENSRQSAAEIVPLILDILPIDRVVDVGCGDGTWLQVFQQHGVKEIKGIDGSYVDENILVISKDDFMDFDLTKPLKMSQVFDLVISLEVAEHLPVECAETFIDSLTNLGSVVLFSAAIPYQNGDNHINLQWQEFWADLFQQRGYLVFDYIRQNIWSNHKVASYYRQNIMMFISEDFFNRHSLAAKLERYIIKDLSLLSVVHPDEYLYAIESAKWIDPEQKSLNLRIKSFSQIVMSSIKRRLGRFSS